MNWRAEVCWEVWELRTHVLSTPHKALLVHVPEIAWQGEERKGAYGRVEIVS